MPNKPFPIVILGALWCLAAASTAQAGWSENVRLTYRGLEISPQVIARNDTVHVVWYQIGARNVSYIRSTDGGNTWGDIIDLNAPGHTCFAAYPNLNLAERGLLVSWFDYNTIENFTSIGIRKSSNGGGAWSAPSYVGTDNPNHFGNPVSAVKGDSIFLVYLSSRNDSTGIPPLRAMHSYDYGSTWSDEVTVGHPLALEAQPTRLKYCNGPLLFAYAGVPDSTYWGHDYIIGYRSIDAGRTWSDTIWISSHMPYDPQDLCLSCNLVNYNFLASYMDYRYSIYAFHGDIFATISNDEGITWPNEYQATNNHTAWWPQMDFVADTLIVVWSDMRYYDEGMHEIFFNRSNTGGLTWQGEERITNTPDESYDPWVSLDNGTVHVVWREEVGGQESEIFYKKFTPDSTDAIGRPDISHPSKFSLSAYPNPFNSSVLISIQAPSVGMLSIYDLTGREILRCELDGGFQDIRWEAKDKNGKGVASGIYLARLHGNGGQSAQVKLVYLK